MLTEIFVRENDKTIFLCKVDLEVVPGGTYIIDNIPYTLFEKPTFIIRKVYIGQDVNAGAEHKLVMVRLVVQKAVYSDTFPA